MHIDIEKLADEFFEWDGPRTPVVTFVSAKLFAKHVAELALEEAAKAQDEWKAMVYAPRDGTTVELLIEHRTWWVAYKCSPNEAKIWRAVCEAKWIDHNGGGWTWEGMAGTPIGWRTLSRQITEG